ncbi:MAG: Outer membrane efflux protein [Limisphaerales bacterium]|nr:MAG: Outer membrane efflux protein [Limisphaerales bacterium]KAG0507014.1 MAG: Outer membrane efflux protein [Limisphaerales bacterium]TXT49407.1 MAG: Outer membrane efflux protein [Limisphaerales bacterium]
MQPKQSAKPFRHTRRLLDLVLAIGFTGCATYEPKPLAPEKSAAAYDARRLDAPELRQFLELQLGRELKTWPLKHADAWSLETLTLAAYFHHPELPVARARWQATQAAELTAGARLNPILSASPTFNFDAASAVSPWKPVANLDLPIETAGKRGLRLARAKQQTEAARHEFFVAAWRVRSGVGAALEELHFAGQLASNADRRATSLKQLLELTEQRQRAGEVSPAAVTAARLTHEKAKLEHDLARERSATAKARLAEAVGVPAREFAELQIAFNHWTPLLSAAELAKLREAALLGRPDLRAALASYEAAQLALQLEVAKQYPDVRLGTGYEWDQGANKWQLFSLAVELPVLNQNQGPIAEARARREAAAAHFNALQARAAANLDSAIANFQAANARVTSQSAMFDAVMKNTDAALALLKDGEGTRIEVLRAQLESLDVERLSAEVTHRHWLAENALEDALQQQLLKPPDGSAPAPPNSLLPATATASKP